MSFYRIIASLAHISRIVGAWGLILSLVISVWLWGSTRREDVMFMERYINTFCFLWIASTLLSTSIRRRMTFDTGTVFYILIIAFGLLLSVNAKFAFDHESHEFSAKAPFVACLAGSMDRDVSLAAMSRVQSLMLASTVLSILAREAVWRRRIWATIIVNSFLISITGCVQHVFSTPLWFWPGENWQIARVEFAGFRYHGNAAAFLNLAWPLTFGSLLCSRIAGPSRAMLPLSIILLSATIAGVFVNVSKAGGVVALFLMIVLLLTTVLPALRSSRLHLSRRSRIETAILILVGVGGIVGLALLLPWSSWQYFAEESWTLRNPRILVARISVNMASDSGWFGFGPGTWPLMFPYYTEAYGGELAGHWSHAHNDYLQTIIEWGFIGTTLWSAWIFGGIITAIRSIGQMRTNHALRLDKRMLIVTLVALSGVFLHSVGDFPLQIFSIQLTVVTLISICWSSRYWTKDVPFCATY